MNEVETIQLQQQEEEDEDEDEDVNGDLGHASKNLITSFLAFGRLAGCKLAAAAGVGGGGGGVDTQRA